MALAFQGLVSNARPAPSREPHLVRAALGWNMAPSEMRVQPVRISAE
jgi:hypothetical protein